MQKYFLKNLSVHNCHFCILKKLLYIYKYIHGKFYDDIQWVSRETYDRLELCRQALSEWQNKFNLVSRKSLEDAWNRHFLDSAQLYPLLPRGARTLADLGSGAGFPGMVLAIMAAEKHRI